MKFVVPLAVLATLSWPAAASVVHQKSLNHDGQQVTATYQPKIATTFDQTGIGPRSIPRCLWTSKVSVERTVTDSHGQPITKLTRVIGQQRVRHGSEPGPCATLTRKSDTAFAGRDALQQADLLAAAEADATALQTELANRAKLGG